MGNWFSNLKDTLSSALGEQLSNIKQGFENVKESFVNLLEKMAELWAEVNTLPLRIQEKIKELFEYFFVPDEELTNQRLYHIPQMFAFIDSLAGKGESVIDFLQNAT